MRFSEVGMYFDAILLRPEAYLGLYAGRRLAVFSLTAHMLSIAWRHEPRMEACHQASTPFITG